MVPDRRIRRRDAAVLGPQESGDPQGERSQTEPDQDDDDEDDDDDDDKLCGTLVSPSRCAQGRMRLCARCFLNLVGPLEKSIGPPTGTNATTTSTCTIGQLYF